MNYLKDMIDLALSQHRDRGIIRANGEWTKCWDIDGISEELKDIGEHINSITKRIRTTMLNIDLLVSDAEFENLTRECEAVERESMGQREIEIEREYRPKNAFFDTENNSFTYGPMTHNKAALINFTQCIIPEDISIALSYGPKFLFPFNTTNENILL